MNFMEQLTKYEYEGLVEILYQYINGKFKLAENKKTITISEALTILDKMLSEDFRKEVIFRYKSKKVKQKK